MRQRYWIEFDVEGEIEGIYKSKSDAEYISGKPCEEFIVKLIPINRTDQVIDDINTESKAFINRIKKVSSNAKKFQTELDKLTKDVRRFKIWF